MSGFRLKRLDVAAFRGVREKVRTSLDRPLNILYGPNGSGKSSLLTAIEWALFPAEVVRLRESGIDERRSWEVGHIYTRDYPDVTLVLDGGVGELSVRQYGRKGSVRRTNIACRYADFKHLVYVHQETLRDFLVGSPRPRQQAFARLLGAGWVQDLSSGFGRARRELRCEDADRRVGDLERLLEAKMAEVGRLLAEEKTRARTLGLAESWKPAAGAVQLRVGDLLGELWRVAGQSESEAPPAEPLETYSRRVEETLSSLRQMGPAREQTDLAGRKTRLDSAGSAYVAASRDRDQRRAQLAELESKAGGSEVLVGLESRREELKREAAVLDRRRAVVLEALEYFREKPDAAQCPVCDQDVPDGLSSRLEQRFRETKNGLSEQLSALAQQIDELRGQAEQMRHLSSAVARAEVRLKQEVDRLLKTLERPPAADEDLLACARDESRRLAAQLAESQRAVDEWLRKLAAVADEANKMEVIHRIVALEGRMRKLAAIRDTREWEDMVHQQRLLSLREQHYRLSVERLSALSAGLATLNLQRVHEPISRIYTHLSNRGDFGVVVIDPEKKYEVALEAEAARWAPTAVLNLTDLNSLAIAVISGMAVTFRETTDLDFLILDDPSQGMDAGVAARLGEVLGELARTIQLVVATPDQTLLEALERSPLQKNIVRLASRDEVSKEPRVRIER